MKQLDFQQHNAGFFFTKNDVKKLMRNRFGNGDWAWARVKNYVIT